MRGGEKYESLVDKFLTEDATPDSAYANKIASKELGLSPKDRIVVSGGDTTGHSGNTNLIKIDEI